MAEPIHIVVVTGLSGSGKSTAIRALEDMGYFCIDNLPVALLPKFLDLVQQSQHGLQYVALVMDLRERGFSSMARSTFSAVRDEGHHLDILFLEADIPTLVKRYSETRRRHPLSPEGSVRDGVIREITELDEVRHLANPIIDTSNLTVHDLKHRIQDLYSPDPASRPTLTINVLSFGFKHGLPPEADLVFDVRFLNNPYFREDLRPLSGKDAEVAEYVLRQPAAQSFLALLGSMLDFLLPQYKTEGKTYLTVAVGCTGGQHRSVAIALATAQRLQALPYNVNVRHRDCTDP
ncbi:MAG: RNase adapter RapZ [Myxococcales bacterium]|nr:RNase adapter RapZ [Myxococcales bacterium]